ncbi:DUF6176 family protein [Vibrio sp. SCSIO 43136]|uniref:DUF6176 family protein n=1 Tax=Vibrio sp. SCSIO 43136 TaxID=2819101 RepID=UPI0020760B0B|nr:DUF6176 family protein [Vibrio sp. SCSIO 43136]USD66960.1 hypothetical protein J4N39_20160 [Vibrio sp. SCSIO 43136]
MEMASGLIKLRDGVEQNVTDWQLTMASRLEEVRASLVEEGVEFESWFRVNIDGAEFLLWYMRAECMQKANEVFQNSENAIDKVHYEFLARVTENNGHYDAEPLLDLSTVVPADCE